MLTPMETCEGAALIELSPTMAMANKTDGFQKLMDFLLDHNLTLD